MPYVEKLSVAAVVNTWFRSRPRLADIIDGRNNNFDLIRLVAALGVIYGHSFFEVTDESEGLVASIFGGTEYAGSIAVYAFFLISGIMISASLEKHRSALAFIVLRWARIWPGFLICCAIILYVVIPLTSGIGWHDRLYAKEAIACLRQNALFFVKDACGRVTEAFPRTPMPGTFGFQFWTLAAEVHCYAVVLLLGIAMRYRISQTTTQRLIYSAGTLVVGGLFLLVATTSLRPQRFGAEFNILGGYSSYPALFFFAGMICYAVRQFIVLDAVSAVAMIVLAAVLPPLHGLLYPILSYALLVVASLKALHRLVPRYDISFGVYIYGTALLQTTATYVRSAPAITMFLLSAGGAIVFAFMSWIVVERPAQHGGRWLVERLGGRGVARLRIG